MLLAHFRNDVRPHFFWNHVPRVAPKTVNTAAAPVKEYIGHIMPKFFMGVIQLHKIFPDNAPRSRRLELAVRFSFKPFRMMQLQRRTPACMIRGKVEKQKPASGMHSSDKFLVLIKRSRRGIKLRHRRVDRIEISRREWATVFTHHGISRRHRERRKSLDYSKPHISHNMVEAANNLTERAELTRENGIYRIVRPRLRALNLYSEIIAFRPFGNIHSLRKETYLP